MPRQPLWPDRTLIHDENAAADLKYDYINDVR